MIDLQETAEGLIVPVQAQPRARRNAVTGVHAGRLKVAVTQAPEKGKANEAIIRVLCEALSLGSAQVSLHSGAAGRVKKVLVRGLSAEEFSSRIGRLLNESPA